MTLPAHRAGRGMPADSEGWMQTLTADTAIRTANPKNPSSVVSAMRFLLEMARNLEEYGNIMESVKCVESALLLRCANKKILSPQLLKPLIDEGFLSHESVEDAAALVLRCNSHAVAAFNAKRFDEAEFYLGKALFLTDIRGTEDVNYFTRADTRRLRLRAATLNNLGCMEKRRGQLQKSLQYLRQAVGIEVSLDNTARGSPSTYLNLCTVLNEQQQHDEAVAAAENAVSALEEQLLLQQKEQLPGCAMMLVVGLYNLGVSLQRRGREGDSEKARIAYHKSLEASRKFFVDPNCPTVELAMAAIRRMHGSPAFRKETIEPAAAITTTPAAAASTSTIEPATAASDVQMSSSTFAKAEEITEKRVSEEEHMALSSIVESSSESLSCLISSSTSRPHQKRGFPSRKEQEEEGAKEDLQVQEQREQEQEEEKEEQFQQQQGEHLQEQMQELEEQYRLLYQQHEKAEEEFLQSQKHKLLIQQEKQQQEQEQSEPQQQQERQQLPQSRATRLTPLANNETSGNQWAQPTHSSSGTQLSDRSVISGSVPTFAKTVPTPNLPQRSALRPPLPLHSPTGGVHAQTVPGITRPQVERFGSVSSSLRLENSIGGSDPMLRLPRPMYEESRNSAPRPPLLAPITRSSQSPMTSMKTLPELPQTLSLITSFAPKSPNRSRKMSTSSHRLNLSNPFGRRMFGSVGPQESTGSSSSSQQQRWPLTVTEAAAMEKHIQRAQLRQIKTEEIRRKSEFTGRRGSALAKAKEREQKQLAKEQAKRDIEMADSLYEKLVNGMRAEEMNRCNRAATLIQRIWRGCLARTLIRRMVISAKRIQRVFRTFLVALLAARRAEEERLARLKAAREKQETEAAIFLQGRVRQFLRRLEIRRAYIGRKMRRYYAARRIQREFRAFLKWREEHLAALMEAQRLEDERQIRIAENAARRIQWAFKRYLGRKEEIKASQLQQKRERAAAFIQAHVRGILARAWFRYYKSYRREQELKSAVNQKRIIMIQSAARGILAVRLRRMKEVELVNRLRQNQFDRAATKIQCQWRNLVARTKLERLRAERQIQDRRATRIQRWYATCVLRRRFLKIREANRRESAAVKIQNWFRDLKIRRKEKETARYHANMARRQRLARLQAQSLVLLQAWGKAYLSTLLVRSVRCSFLRLTLYGEEFQRIGRGYTARQALCRLRCRVITEARMRVEMERKIAAACIIQRAWRCAAAKAKVEHMRRCVAAAVVISKHYRGYLCRKELRRLREVKRLEKETRAAITLQRAVRDFLKRLELVRLDKYYRERQQKKLLALRRVEATTILQAAWRGRATRKALEHERKALEELTMYAVKIQRTWQARKFRRKINVEVSRRSLQRMGRNRAALKIQCFWRKMMAAEVVARLRETNRIRCNKVIIIQHWWRCILAKHELESLKAKREEEIALQLHYAAKWDTMVTLINSVLRVRLAQEQLLIRKRKYLLTQLTDRERDRFLRRHTAATKIQAVYRGNYERVYARGVRRAKEEEERRKKEREALERCSAIKIQCAYRKWRAICEANFRRRAKREKLLQEEIEHCTTIDPHDMVRQLFWVHESVIKRDLLKERIERGNQHDKAAIVIQKTVRQWIAKKRIEKMRREAVETEAAKIIQDHWKQYRTHELQKEFEKQNQAAIIIQARFRGYLVRRDWEQWRKQMAFERQHEVVKEDVLDNAATVLQSFWRRIIAERISEKLREQRQEKKLQDVLDESASTIQRAYRRYRLRCFMIEK
ncbi:IQ motif [Trypanosoma melophagium]|uniref:IQ motif n=1 Tax=Trypanosoma melophagium TaxID=715481 RepID=UPI003519E8BA|nr:IQ motif [Trypanosoma melophagium]